MQQRWCLFFDAAAGEEYELLPRAAAGKIYERDAAMVVLNHARITAGAAEASADDEYYARFKVPDDPTW